MPKDIKGRSRALKILIADDNRDHVDTLGLLLKADGHQVHIAYDGASALEVARLVRPDVALLDIGMPVLSGRTVAEHIRSQEWGRSIYLVAVTAWSSESDKKQSVDAGFDRHLTKPLNFDTLTSILNFCKQLR